MAGPLSREHPTFAPTAARIPCCQFHFLCLAQGPVPTATCSLLVTSPPCTSFPTLHLMPHPVLKTAQIETELETLLYFLVPLGTGIPVVRAPNIRDASTLWSQGADSESHSVRAERSYSNALVQPGFTDSNLRQKVVAATQSDTVRGLNRFRYLHDLPEPKRHPHRELLWSKSRAYFVQPPASKALMTTGVAAVS